MAPDIHIRCVRPDEAPRLSALMRALFLESYANCSTSANVEACLAAAFAPDRQAAELDAADRMTWVAEQGDRWHGFAQARFDAAAPAGVTLARPAQLHRLYLAGPARGTGLGRRLLDTVRGAARERGADGLWLSVWQQAPGPIAFYTREGFSIVGQAVFDVGGDPLQDWIMQARLAPNAPA